MKSLDDIQQENNSLKEIIQHKDSRIKILEAYIQTLKQKQFSASSEKLDAIQPDIFSDSAAEADAEISADIQDTVVVAEHQRKTKRASIPKELPRVDIIHDLSNAEKFCPHDGTALKHIGAETHEQLDIIPAKIQVLNHIRLKYACPCCEKHLITANKPAQPIEKSIASPGLLAFIATQKYVDALPLYRQIEGFKRIGIELDRSTLAQWMQKCGLLLQPLVNLIHDKVLEQKYLHMDETIVQVLNEPGKAAQSQSYMWVLRSTLPTCSAVLFQYEPTRSGSVPSLLLRDFSGALMADGYTGYNAVCTNNGITRLGCWAHARRKFIEAQKVQPKGKTGKADQGLAYIQSLYRIEQTLSDKTENEKYGARQQQSQPILDKLKDWLEKSLPKTPPQTPIGKALTYLHNQWPHLIRYVCDGDYPLDNNAAENAIRPFVIGRKNWLFSASQKGATASANLYSIIETAKTNGLEPYAYLKRIFTELPNAKTLGQIESLLPWNCTTVTAE
ncbi:MAG: IS66 family transposase [Marinagarivorans sp.]|nr:IS66 family transposase [Marinagarivorans sp.]